MKPSNTALALAASWCLAGTSEADPSYGRFQVVTRPNDCQVSGGGHAIPCCTVDGWDFSGNNVLHPKCSTLYDVFNQAYSCSTDQPLPGNPGAVAQNCCACNTNVPAPNGTCNTPERFVDEAINPANYQCEPDATSTDTSQPEQCDGISGGTIPVDKGCGGDEHGCHLNDSDPAPVRYSSGRVQSNPITLFSIPTPDDVLFGYRIIYNSHAVRTAAQRNTVNGVHDERPVIHHSEEDTHYIGRGWLDNFSDRLYITAFNVPANQITWVSQNGTVTFINNGGAWKSWSGKFELIDRGPSPADGFGRWVVRTSDPSAPRRIWAFEEFTYTPYNGSAARTLGRLRRRAVLTANLANLTGRYGFTVTWTPDGTISNAVDSLGRQLEFDYQPQLECTHTDPTTGQCDRVEVKSNSLAAVQYRPSPEAPTAMVARLQLTTANDRLERIIRPGVAGYTRFLYWNKPPTVNCVHCGSLLSDVILPGDLAASSPAMFAPVLSTEVVAEHNDYAPGPSPSTVVGVRSKAPGREYAYEYTQTSTTQFDLNQDGGPCGAGNTCTQPGHACRTVNELIPRCYVADVILHETSSGLGSLHVSAGAGPPTMGLSGNARSFERHYSANGAPRDLEDAAGIRTSYGFDTAARIRCIVHNDNDSEAFTDPTQPETSGCAGPSASQSVRVDYGATSITTITPSVLAGSVSDVRALDPVSLLPATWTMTGMTKDINGNQHAETHSFTTSYDSLGRIVQENGPLNDTVAYDMTTIAYYDVPDVASPYNYGQIRTITQYVGTASSNTPLTTVYAEYDLFGVPHRVTEPNGNQTLHTASADRLVWTITAVDSSGTTVTGPSVVTMNANGTVRSVLDADGICLTYEYADATGYVGAPTVVRRSDSACGVLPINQNSGEVEIRTYVRGEQDRLESLTRKTNGVTEFSYSGFVYDRDRRLISSSTLDSSGPFTYSFTDVLRSATTAPGGPSAGSWKTEMSADSLGRPSVLSRFIDTTNRLTYSYSYTSSFLQRPTMIRRGFNGSGTAVAAFVYDDFGRLLEAAVPEAFSATRYEYDVADRLVKRRIGLGTPEVNTTSYSYDSLDRVLFVDHDLEHPVTCSTSGAGTPIEDVEYAYDSCPADTPAGFACANALGRRVMSRTIVQCGTSHDVVKRGRWYSYDKAGRIGQVAYATVTGSVIAAPAIMTYAYDAAGRMLSYSSPLNTAFGTKYTLAPADGRVSAMTTTSTPGSPIASNMVYRAFGGLTELATASVQVVSGGSRVLTMYNTYRSDDTLTSIASSFSGTGASTVDVMNAALSYTPAGLLQQRNDSADSANTRYYGYDSLQRLICETRTTSSADCTVSSSNLAALFTYGNAQNSATPFDTRMTAYINNPSYISPVVETYNPSALDFRINVVASNDSRLVLGYDGVGRRIFDYVESAAGPPGGGGSKHAGLSQLEIDETSRRDYMYLPNGQLGRIDGTTQESAPISIAMRYDEGGRPITISYDGEANYELFWDDADRLIAVSIAGPPTVRWHYHYLGRALIAATREVVAGSTTVKRFWTVTDERGLILRMVDENGATYWQARWDATAWRSLVGTPQPNMWVPFGLPGQLILDGSEAYSTIIGNVRPAIALNQIRAYDPLLGSFLQPDPADESGRLLPEGYVYGRGNPVGHVDVSGARSKIVDEYNKIIPPGWELRFDSSCSPEMQRTLRSATEKAIADINRCSIGKCGETFAGPNLKRQWTFAMLTGENHCLNKGEGPRKIDGETFHLWTDADVRRQASVRGPGATLPIAGSIHNSLGGSTFARTMADGPYRTLGGRVTVFSTVHAPGSCWARTVAHEALHGVISTIPADRVIEGAYVPDRDPGELYYGAYRVAGTWELFREFTQNQQDEEDIIAPLEKCVRCQ